MKKFTHLFVILLFSQVLAAQNILVKGKVSTQFEPVPNVAITDGRSFVFTDVNGEYQIEATTDQKFVYYVLPAGYHSPVDKGIPIFYKPIDSTRKIQEANFNIYKSEVSQHKHKFLLMADPQILDWKEFDYLDSVITETKSTIDSFNTSEPVYAICAGDIVFDKLNYFERYKEVISSLEIPFYHVIGNHDLDYNLRSNENSDLSFSKSLGPSYYSFNIGKIHYVVLKNVFYYGFSYRYIGYIDENQLNWLEEDLSLVQPGSTVVVSLHIPTIYGEREKAPDFASEMSNSLMNRTALYQILSPFNVHILAGHSHKQWNTEIKPNLFEHVHAAVSGAWWQGEICTDGTPLGYTVYEVEGDSLSWYFKAVNLSDSEQFKLYGIGEDDENPEHFIVNVFNYDSKWKVQWYENEVFMGQLQPFWGKDLLAEKLYQVGQNKKHSWLGAGFTKHLFKGKPSRKGSKIRVEVIDRFGTVFNKELTQDKYRFSLVLF